MPQKKGLKNESSITKAGATKKPVENNTKMSNKEKARFSDMNQIEWVPLDPYGD